MTVAGCRIERIEELQHADHLALARAERHGEHGDGAIAALGIHLLGAGNVEARLAIHIIDDDRLVVVGAPGGHVALDRLALGVEEGNLEAGQFVALGALGEAQGLVLGQDVERAGVTVEQFLSGKQNLLQQGIAVVLATEIQAGLDQVLQLGLGGDEILGALLDRFVHDGLGFAEGVNFIKECFRLVRRMGEVEQFQAFGILRQGDQGACDLARTR